LFAIVVEAEVFSGNWSAATYSIDAYTELRERNKSYTDVAGYYAFSSSGMPVWVCRYRGLAIICLLSGESGGSKSP
jgi:hypothetical protein